MDLTPTAGRGGTDLNCHSQSVLEKWLLVWKSPHTYQRWYEKTVYIRYHSEPIECLKPGPESD